MADLVVGIAILDKSQSPERLYCYCQPEGKKRFQEDIPVYPKGHPKPCDPAWQYEIKGVRLHITPSLWVKYQIPTDSEKEGEWITMFHNAGAWDVEFKIGVEADLRQYNP